MKLKKLLLGTLAPITTLPIAISVSCGNTKTKQEDFDFSKLSADKQKEWLQTNFNKLTEADKYKFVENLDLKGKLTMDQKAKVINMLIKDAGSYGGIVWYIKSVEAYISKEVTYKNAMLTFEYLKSVHGVKEKFDYTQNFNEKQKVENPAIGFSIPVVFMDIDETVLQNDYTETYGMLNGGYSDSMKEQNDVKALRFALPGVVDFINHVHEHGGLVIYNSDMSQSTEIRNKVKENLKKIGIKYVEDFQFWMRGSMPYEIEDEDAYSNEKTKDLDQAAIKKLAEGLKFKNTFAKTPWRTWDNTNAAYNFGKKVYKTDRMNGLDDNTAGWDFKQVDNKSGDKVVLKTIMKIGDNYNDFFDRMSKGKSNTDRVKSYLNTKVDDATMSDLFFIEGGVGLKYVEENNEWKFKKLDYHQAYVMVPGNCEYGGWNEEYGYGTFIKFYEALKSILADKKYQDGPTAENPVYVAD